MTDSFRTTHNLQFEVAESPYEIGTLKNGHKMFRVGTCEGQWGDTGDSYYILSVANNQEGNGYIDDYYGWDFANNDNDPMDDHGHGTHTVGTIAGVGNNAANIAGE